ncbi:MAG: AraC family transcriptional regulator [Lachnospiraceae bacterium]|nr:AraC family transcriptional regulator [Lachnospiraceae bacterium]
MKHTDTMERNKYYHCLEYDHDQQGDICLISCGMEECDPGVVYGDGVRDCYHLHIILSGKGILKIGDQILYPRFGQMFLLKDNEYAYYQADEKDPWKYCWVTYKGTDARRLSDEIGFGDGIYCLDSAKEAEEFFSLIRRMHEKPEMNYINDLRRKGILLEFLALAPESTAAAGVSQVKKYEYSPEVYVQRAIEFIQYNYSTIRVADVIEYVGFTRSYFTTLFKRQTGRSIQEYIKQIRLRRSCELLQTTDRKIGDIAEKVGYPDQLAFSKIFKAAYGLSPAAFRKEQNTVM